MYGLQENIASRALHSWAGKALRPTEVKEGRREAGGGTEYSSSVKFKNRTQNMKNGESSRCFARSGQRFTRRRGKKNVQWIGLGGGGGIIVPENKDAEEETLYWMSNLQKGFLNQIEDGPVTTNEAST
ncbi:hypothetical protein DFH09DRAFT_1071674 [Mycena vulgaris]|nr:hypothetical protein DFH09DRAFT_1071674 [Mycena vulgaris]